MHVRLPITRIAVAYSFQSRNSHYTLITFHLRTLSDGGPHPAAKQSEIQHLQLGTSMFCFHAMSLSSSRLAMLGGKLPWRNLMIWDWRSGNRLFVRRFFLLFYSVQISSTRLGVVRGPVLLTGVHR